MNKKGFTLIELLATITLLAVLMIIAVPNIIGVVNRNKNKSYIEDAKKLVSLAEYKVRSDSALKPLPNQVYCYTMEYLGSDEFGTAPNGGNYSLSKSYVAVSNVGGSLTYKVQLIEYKCKEENKGADKKCIEDAANNKLYGISEISSKDLYEGNPIDIVDPSHIKNPTCTKKDGK